jgi:dTDP-glucose 4,6-dehydratase
MKTSKPLVLLTGGAGFIGANLVRLLLETKKYRVLVLDALTYAGNLENLDSVKDHPEYEFLKGDITSPEDVARAFERGPTLVAHLAAESHVDRSLEDAGVFLRTNIEGTRVLLDAARKAKVTRFVQVSTDEVYGSLTADEAPFTETSPLKPSSPYSASKTGADLLALAYFHSFGLPVSVTRCSNNYGPFQFPEKLIPLMISNALRDEDLPVYGDGQQVRDWIHVEDHCRAIEMVLAAGEPGQVYNFGGESELPNLTVVETILKTLEKPHSLIRYVEDRLGHDRRYAIDNSLSQERLGFEPRWNFQEGLAATVQWYQNHQDWWERIKSGAYRDFYQRQYQERLQDSDQS